MERYITDILNPMVARWIYVESCNDYFEHCGSSGEFYYLKDYGDYHGVTEVHKSLCQEATYEEVRNAYNNTH
jgi:hypothetical protein